MGLLDDVLSALDVVELLDEDVKLADDVIVDAKADVIVDSTDPDADAVDTTADTAVVGNVERSVEEAMMTGEFWWPLGASRFLMERCPWCDFGR